MTSFRVTILIAAFLLVLYGGYAAAQQSPGRSFYFEAHIAAQSSFGPSENQAEIAGGIDTLSYDNKEHLSSGFKSGIAGEFVGGYCKNKFQLQSTIGYFVQDIGLVQKLSSNEYSFLLADMLSIKASALLQLSDQEKRGPYGLYTGIFIGSVFPISYNMNEQTKINFAFNDIRPAAQYYWGIDFSYSLSLGKKGLYAISGASVTMPGLLGCIGRIQMQPSSAYSIIRDKIQMYSIKAFMGIGFRLKELKYGK